MGTELNHANMVRKLAKPGDKIQESLDPLQCALMHHTFGICGEAGELLDSVKKHIIYNKPLDIANIIEELGDIEFYMQGLRMELGINRFDVLEANMEKLSKRYGTDFKYSNKSAIARKDKENDNSR